MVRQRTRSTSSQFLTCFWFPSSTSRKVDHTVTDSERKKEIKNITLRINSKRSAGNENSWAFTIGSFVMHDSERPWSNWVALKKWFAKWTSWRTRTTHHATEEELNVYRSNWWIRSNFVGSDTMPIRHRADFKEALSTLRRLKNEEDQACYQNWWQSSSSSWWNWQDSWWHPSSEYHRDDGPTTDGAGKPAKTVNGLIISGMSLKINLVQKLQWLIR